MHKLNKDKICNGVKVNPVRELSGSLTVSANGGFEPPSALSGDDRRLKSAAFSNGVNIKKILIILMCFIIISPLNVSLVEPGISIQGASAYNGTFANLCNLLNNLKPSDLSFCLGYVKNCDYNSSQIAKFILTWSPDMYRKKIPSIFISKLDRLIKILNTLEYQQLIIEIDIVRNSQLTVEQMVKLIKSKS